MKVRDLVAALSGPVVVGERVSPDAPLGQAHSDSRAIGPGDLFIALPGRRSQGVDYLEAAFAAGCGAALIAEDTELPDALRSRCIAVSRIRHNAARAACVLYGHPSESLLTLGVTGTNGKTSSCYILKHLLEAGGHRVVLITTVAHQFEEWHEDTPNTTPDAALLQSVLARARDHGATAAVVEISAHGIALDRIGGCRFDGLLFTNLSPDHQDDFPGMDTYFEAKRTLFANAAYHKPACVAAINSDCAYGRRMLAETACRTLPFGTQANTAGADASGLAVDAEGIRGQLSLGERGLPVRTTLTGAFNRMNLAGASTLAAAAGLPLEPIGRALQGPITVPGRLMNVPTAAPFQVIVDFAHSESALQNLLGGLRGECGGRMIVVFGAGGDKDPSRRRTLPRVALHYADVAVITLDNPRSEEPGAIIDTMVKNWHQLAAGISEPAQLHIEPDRPQAIAMALGLARAGDIVVLAGKGHETTQIFADRIEHHDDSEIAGAWLAERFPRSRQAGATQLS